MSRILNPGEAERLVTQFLTDTRANTMARHQAGHEESDRHRASLGLEPFWHEDTTTSLRWHYWGATTSSVVWGVARLLGMDHRNYPTEIQGTVKGSLARLTRDGVLIKEHRPGQETIWYTKARWEEREALSVELRTSKAAQDEAERRERQRLALMGADVGLEIGFHEGKVTIDPEQFTFIVADLIELHTLRGE